jgi:acyl dehydratase
VRLARPPHAHHGDRAAHRGHFVDIVRQPALDDAMREARAGGDNACSSSTAMPATPISSPHQPRRHDRLADLQALVGQEIGLSDWVVIDQARINAFAECTGDLQWIHVDPVRAAAGPFGTPIAHGHLTLSLLPLFQASAFLIADVRMGVNYGLNRVRFPAPVPVGARLRGRFVLQSYRTLEGGAELVVEVTVEREGHSKPACVAESIAWRYSRVPG